MKHQNGLDPDGAACHVGQVVTILDSHFLRVLSYVGAFAICLFAARHSPAPGRQRLWLTLALVAGLLCLTRLFGWDNQLADRAREDAYQGGWYTGRRPVQEALVLAALALGGIALLVTLAFASPARGFRALAVTFVAALCVFVAARAVSLHALDHLLFRDTAAGVQRGALIELCLIAGLAGCGLLDIGLLRWRRRSKGTRVAVMSPVDGSGWPAG